MKNKLFQLMALNKGAGSFKLETSGDEATLWLYDMIVDSDVTAEWWGGVSAESLVKELRGLSASTIHIRINSPGGDVFAARTIEQAIREHSATVIAHVDGYAASAASLVSSACDQVIMAPGSFIMIHKAWTIAIGNADDLMGTADLLEKIDGTIAQSYENKAGDAGKDTDFGALMAAETWLTPEEAVAVGLADEVASSGPKASAQPRWNMSAYQHAPTPVNDVEEPKPAPEKPAAEKIDHRARSLRLIAQAA